MLKFENPTGMPAVMMPAADREGRDHLVVIVKGTFEWDDRGAARFASEQQTPVAADVYFDEPGKSSVRYASDYGLTKPGTDIALIGHAYAPKGSCTEVDVSLEVGALKKTVRVFGDRVFSRTLTFWRISPPAPFDRMPLVYERSFGGIDVVDEDPAHHGYEPRNPVGTGYSAKGSRTRLEGLHLPNLERPEALISHWKHRPDPTGFGFVAPDWMPRRALAGTYDEAWHEARCPLLPVDFDARFFNAAASDLVASPHLVGGEDVRLVHLVPEGPTALRLPAVALSAELLRAGPRPERTRASLVLDTVVLEPDDRRLSLTWRAKFDCTRTILYVESVALAVDRDDTGALS